MKCVDVEKYIEDFANDELDLANHQKIENHLEECRECLEEIENLQNTRRLLKDLPAVSPAAQFDARMMQTFQKHHEKKSATHFWTNLPAYFSLSKPAFALGLLAFVILTGLAFQLGRMSSPNAETAQQVTTQTATQNEANQLVQIVEKRVEVPIIKTVEVPVYRERIVNRIIYRNRDVAEKTKFIDANETPNFASPNNTATFVQTSDEGFTPINLKNFQPISEMKISIIKKGEGNEK
jgi:anti-sigma factor RsiW